MKLLSKYTGITPKFGIMLLVFSMPLSAYARADSNELKIIETKDAIEIHTPAAAAQEPDKTTSSESKTGQVSAASTPVNSSQFDPLKYTLGPDDVVEIAVMRHPEFSGTYPINQEGKLQYKFVGDIDVVGLTKLQLEQKIKEIISNYVISPEINVTVIDYKSKVFYMLGEIGAPGKYYMRSETIPVREAVFQAGLPTASAAMRKCQIITPDKKGRAKIKKVNLYAILYAGNLKRNIDMHPGEVLYIPSTVMAKIIRVINPVASTIGIASSAPSSASTAKTSAETLAR